MSVRNWNFNLTVQHSKTQVAQYRAARPPGASPLLQQHSGGTYPLHFGRAEHPLFGWLHIPDQPVAPGIGLVICNPFGNEALCAHRSIRHLAEHASRAGIAVLRFDYDGTGDSAGHDYDPARLEAWIGSTQTAADELKRAAGVEYLCLLGIRLGATLATKAAAQRDDVAALIAIAPVVNGRAYLRELRLLQKAIDAKRAISRAAEDQTLETAGFLVSAETQASLGGIDLKKLERLPAPSVLVLERAEMPGDAGWIEHLRAGGAQVERHSVGGYTEMMLDSHESIVPHEMIKTTVDWLSALDARGAVGKPPGPRAEPNMVGEILERRREHIVLPRIEHPDPVTGSVRGAGVLESAVRFGKPPTLFGIVSAPKDAAGVATRGSGRAVLFLNSGAVHQVGPNRLYVAVARHLARHGYVVLRMDISGIGDSPPQPGAAENVVYSPHALQEVRAALDYLRESWDITDVAAVGLCSGAYNAFKAAAAGMPLSRVILINPLTFFWQEGMSLEYSEHRVAHDIVRYRTNAFRLGPWMKLLRGEVNLWQLSQVLVRRLWTVALEPLRTLARTLRIPLSDDLPSELRAIVRAGIQLHFIFAEHDPGGELLDNLGGKVGRRLRARGAIGVQTIGAADHTFTDHTARALLVAAIDKSLAATVVKPSLSDP